MAHDAAAVLKQVKNLEDFRVLMALLEQLDYENLITTNQAEIARELDMQRQNVQRSIKRLMALGVLLRGRRSALAAPTGSTRSSVGVERQEPHRHAGSGAQEANGEGRDQGRDRGRPASPAGSPRARPEHAGYVHRVNPREAPTGCLRTNPRSEARAHLRKLRLQCSEPEPKRVLRAEGALRCFSETARSKSRSRAPSGGPPGAFATWQAAGGRAPQPPARSVGVVPGRQGCCCAVVARALTPIHSDSAPPPPLRGPLARFSSGGRVKGLVRPAAPAGARTRPLDATGATQACRQGVGGALFPGTPALGERPRQGRRRRL